MRLAFVSDMISSAVRAWNTDDTAEALKAQGFDCENLVVMEHEKLSRFDAIVFYRTRGMNPPLLAEQLQRQGKLVGYMIDDLVWDKSLEFYCEQTAMSAKWFFTHADFFVFTSRVLANVAARDFPSAHGVRMFHRPPAILERRFREMETISDDAREAAVESGSRAFRLVISKGHITSEFVRLTRFLLDQASFMTPVELYYYSVERIFDDLESRNLKVIQLKPAYFDIYCRSLASLAPDVILCPFKPSQFNDCKCYPKYLEAGAVGATLLTSNIAPYRDCVKHTENGLIANSEEELLDLLFWATTHRQDIRRMGLEAREDVRRNHLLEPHAVRLYQQIKELYDIRRTL